MLRAAAGGDRHFAFDLGLGLVLCAPHRPPRTQARRLLSVAGGQVVHVFCDDGGTRVSYRPYRETSAALLK